MTDHLNDMSPAAWAAVILGGLMFQGAYVFYGALLLLAT